MKSLLLLLAAALLGMAAFLPYQPAVLEGKVTDDSGEALIGATVKAFRGAELMGSSMTGVDGRYRLLLEPGTYDIEVAYTGYTTSRTSGAVVLPGKTNMLDVIMTGGTVLEAVTVTASDVPPLPRKSDLHVMQNVVKDDGMDDPVRFDPDPTPSNMAPKPEKPETPPTAPTAAGEIAKRRELAKPADDRADRARAKTKAPAEARLRMETAEKKTMKDGPEPPVVLADELIDATAYAGEPAPSPGIPSAPSRRAGLLTAGEWNDLHNWNTHWAELLADGETDAYQTLYKFYPKNRYAVLLQNEQGLPITDAAIKLQETSGRIIWETRTDNLGRAELWNGLYGETASTDLQVRAVVDGQEYPLGQPRPFKDGLNRYELQRPCQSPKNVDIVWTVDATGSMGDEIDYLKTELLDVIGRARKANPGLAVRSGSVFYRDQGDEYLVKSSPLTADAAKTVDYIRQQEAGGGGDWPEAVHSALEEAIFKQDWSESAVARICFLVLDASPHQNPDVVASLQRSIREAARRGIRIVPVSASGVQKDTEFLMKFFGLATNGTYVFLTDHSGIGGKHMEPTTDEYKVELLNDLLVRIITEYSTVETCEGKTVIRYDQALADPNQNGQQQSGPGWQAFFYPNPASTGFSLDLPIGVQSVTLYDAQGKAVRKVEKPQAGLNLISVSDLSEGFYTIRIFKDGGVQSGKLMVVRG
jgi:hypothetical protein